MKEQENQTLNPDKGNVTKRQKTCIPNILQNGTCYLRVTSDLEQLLYRETLNEATY